MPGVPSGRACEGCRKQKKKCDEKQPTCGRCLRLKIECVGSGMQRFKFQQEHKFQRAKAQIKSHGNEEFLFQTSEKPTRSPPSHALNPSKRIVMPRKYGQALNVPIPSEMLLVKPSNELTQLADAFVRTIKRSTDLRYNLGWSFGLFLEDVPRRLGTNEALDRAIEAVVTAHGDFCMRQQGSVQALTKYSAALRTLRVYLDDKVHAQESNTLAAVMVLLICQTFLGYSNQMWSGHAEGAAQILRARGQFGPRDKFETKLFLSLRGSVLFEGLFNERINLAPEEWNELIVNELDSETPDGRMLRCLARGPRIVRRARNLLHTGVDSTGVRDELWSIYQTCKLNLNQLQKRNIEKDLSDIVTELRGTDWEDTKRFILAFFERAYGIGLCITLFFNCMLQSLDIHRDSVQVDAVYFAEETLVLARLSHVFRPIGAGYLIICLSVAWAANSDPELRSRLLTTLKDYHDDFKVRDPAHMMAELDWTAEHIHLGTPFENNSIEYGQRTDIAV